MKKIKTLIRLIKSKDPLIAFEILRRVGKMIMPKYRFKWPQIGWWNDPMFNEYLTKFGEINGMNTDRRWMQYQLLRLVRNVSGDTAECGVYNGAGSYIICKANQENELFNKTHHIFDSFEGLSGPSKFDGEHWEEGDLSCPLETVKENLSRFKNIKIYKGWIPQQFSKIAHLYFCFVHIDVDLYQPTLDSIEFFYPLMNEGGVVVCDDYGFTSCPGATRAIDQFLQNKKEKMISLSGGGGFFIKGTEISEPFKHP